MFKIFSKYSKGYRVPSILTPVFIVFEVIGNGHGVGMSQVGANYYASIGYTYSDIISHYYTK